MRDVWPDLFQVYLFVSPQKKKEWKDENTEKTQTQSAAEAQKETIRLIDIGLPRSKKVYVYKARFENKCIKKHSNK